MLDYLDIKALCVLYKRVPAVKYYIKKHYNNGLPISLHENCIVTLKDGLTVCIQYPKIQILLHGQELLTASINKKKRQVIIESLHIVPYYIDPGTLRKIIIELINEDYTLINKPKLLHTKEIRNLELSETTLMAIPNHVMKQFEIDGIREVNTLHDKFIIL